MPSIGHSCEREASENAVLDALCDLLDGKISHAQYDVLSAEHDAKFPRPEYDPDKGLEPWERRDFLPHLAPSLRKLVWHSTAKVSAKPTRAEPEEAQRRQGLERPLEGRTPVGVGAGLVDVGNSQCSDATAGCFRTGASSAREIVTRLQVPANRNLKAWGRMGDDEKLAIIGRVAEAAGAVSITAHMSARKQSQIRRSAASGRDACQRLADDIARQFRKRKLPVPPLLFGLEVAPKTGKIHIHGVYVPTDRTPEYYKLVRDVFQGALGKIKGQSGSTQFDSVPLYTSDRWLAYINKSALGTTRHLGVEKLLYVSNSMRRLGRDFHEASRGSSAKAFASNIVPKACSVGRHVSAARQRGHAFGYDVSSKEASYSSTCWRTSRQDHGEYFGRVRNTSPPSHRHFCWTEGRAIAGPCARSRRPAPAPMVRCR